MTSRARTRSIAASLLLAGCAGHAPAPPPLAPDVQAVRAPLASSPAVAPARADTVAATRLERPGPRRAAPRVSTIVLIVVVVAGLIFLLASPSPDP